MSSIVSNQANLLENVYGFNQYDKSLLNVSILSLASLGKPLLNSHKSNTLAIVSAQMVADYIALELTASDSHKTVVFKQSLLNGIAKVATLIIKNTALANSLILAGIKIECRGK